MQQTILIVEDHNVMRKTLREWLRGAFPKCRLLEASTGEEAIAAAQVQLADVVVMDISLPAMNGIEATRYIKATLPNTEVLMLSIHEDGPFRIAAFKAGASAYIPKRAIRTELLPALATLLSKADAAQASEPIEVRA